MVNDSRLNVNFCINIHNFICFGNNERNKILKMKKWLIIILIIILAGFTEGENNTNPCFGGWTSEATGFSCVVLSGSGNNNFGLELCEANNNTCSYYSSNETLPLNITKDYIIKIVPTRIDNSSDLRKYFIKTTPMQNLIILICIIFVISMFMKIIIYK